MKGKEGKSRGEKERAKLWPINNRKKANILKKTARNLMVEKTQVNSRSRLRTNRQRMGKPRRLKNKKTQNYDKTDKKNIDHEDENKEIA